MTAAVPMSFATPLLGSRCPTALIAGIREAVAQRAGWPRTAELVGEQVRQHLPALDILTARERLGDPSRYQAHLLHVEPDGSFSVVALSGGQARPPPSTTTSPGAPSRSCKVLSTRKPSPSPQTRPP